MVTKVVGTFDVELTGVPTLPALTAAVAAAFGVDEQYILVAFNTMAGDGGRLLTASRSAPLRSLASKVAIEYEVVVPPNTTKTEEEVLGAALALSESQSNATLAFSKSMLASGVVVVSVTQVEDPVTVQSVIVRDASGAVVKPTQGASIDDTSPGEDSDIDVAAVIGGVIAGLAVLALFGWLVHYLMQRRKTEAPEDMVSTLAV